MALDIAYTSGVIAVREKYLLKERIYRLCELSAEEAFRMLLESGFGGGAETATSVYDYEKLIAVEEEKTDAFIREFAPKKGIAEYLLAPRDFHNAKALVKASKYADWGVDAAGKPQDWGEIPEGRILLQDHSDSTVSFCNLKVKEL